MVYRCAGAPSSRNGSHHRVSVDEQIRGPNRLWVHEHNFEERDGGTLVHDHVHYAVLMDFLLHRFFIRPDIERIFAYRQEQLRALFGGR